MDLANSFVFDIDPIQTISLKLSITMRAFASDPDHIDDRLNKKLDFLR